MIVAWATYNSYGIFFTPLVDEFGWNRAVTSGAFSLSMFIYGILGIVVGALNDRFGPRVVLTACGIILGLGYLLMSQVNSLWQLYLFWGIIIGTGMSGVWVPLLSTVAKWFDKRRTLMSGIVIAGIGIGGLIGPPVISRLIAAYNLSLSYIILGIAMLLLIVLATRFLRQSPDRIVNLTKKSEEKEDHPADKPVTDSFLLKEAVKTPQFWMVFGLFFCMGYGSFSIGVHIVPHAIDMKIPIVSAANILAVRGAISIAGNNVLGALADKIGNRQIFIIGFILTSATLFWLPVANSYWMLYLFIVIFGFATGGMGASESPLTAWLFGMRSHGLIYGVVHVGYTIGAAAGPYITGYIFDLTGSYQMAFLTCAVLSVIGLIFSVLLKPTGKLAAES